MELRYEALLSRIELLRGNREDPEDDGSNWSVSMEGVDATLVVLSGFLKVNSRDGVGRALVHGAIVLPDENDGVIPDVAEVREGLVAESCAELMYDTARRAINMQAAMMDFAFDMPLRAPDTKIKIKRRRRDEDLQDV